MEFDSKKYTKFKSKKTLIERIKYSGTHCISHSPIFDMNRRDVTMPHDLMLRENTSLALLWVPTRVLGITHLPGLVWGTWGLGVVLGLGCGR